MKVQLHVEKGVKRLVIIPDDDAERAVLQTFRPQHGANHQQNALVEYETGVFNNRTGVSHLAITVLNT